MAILDFAAFRATKSPASDEFWEVIKDFIDTDNGAIPRTAFHVYGANADDQGGCLIHEAEGQFWVHAWWYAPLPYATLAEAEEQLYPWYLEFV